MISREHGTHRGSDVKIFAALGEAAMRMILSSTLALLIGTGAAVAYPTEEVPTSEPAYLAKVKTAAPEEIVAKASIVMMQAGKPKPLQTGTNGFPSLILPHAPPLSPTDTAMPF